MVVGGDDDDDDDDEAHNIYLHHPFSHNHRVTTVHVHTFIFSLTVKVTTVKVKLCHSVDRLRGGWLEGSGVSVKGSVHRLDKG